MIYIKSIIAGIAAVAASALIVSFVALLVPTMRVGALGDAWDAFRPLPELARWPLAWFVATVVFVSAFAWEHAHGRSSKH